jgi:hypothetical protein
MNAKIKRVLLPLLRDVKAGKQPTFRARSAAQWLLFQIQKPPKRGLKPARERREKKAAAHRLETALLRAEVFTRGAWNCEFCRTAEATEMHHLEGGIGRRRQMQSVENCVALCAKCHRGYHGDPKEIAPTVLAWAETHGYPVPSRFRGVAAPIQPISSTRGPEQINPPDLPVPAREEEEASNG